jgi:hypothetical protein
VETKLPRCVKIGARLSHCDWPHQLPDYTATCCVAGQALVDGKFIVIQQPRPDSNMNANQMIPKVGNSLQTFQEDAP